MTMMSPGRAISPEGRADGAAERPDAFRGIFVVASSRVTFFDVLVFGVALLEAVLLTVVFFEVLVLLAVVLFVGIVCLPYPERLPPAYFFDVREADGPVLHAGAWRRRDNWRAESADARRSDGPQGTFPVRRPEGRWRYV
jgi:hypothetical protein